MGLKKQIDQISEAHTKSIYIRFIAPREKGVKELTILEMKTRVRAFLRTRKQTPSEAVATPLPR